MKTFTELIILLVLAVFVIIYRKSNGDSTVIKNLADSVEGIYEKYAPYSFKMVREKTKELGQEYTIKQYITQIILLGGFAAIIGYFYFYSILWAIVYAVVAIIFIP